MLRILSSNVLSVLLYGTAMWRMTATEKSAKEILAQPSEQQRAVAGHREYAGVRPHTSEKMAMVRVCIEEMC